MVCNKSGEKMNMNLKYIFSLFLLAFLSVNASDEFTARITNVDGRGTFSNDVLLISNCNDPTKSQNVYLNVDLNYPVEDCNGQMQVFYSYYDFPSGSYTDEAELCFMSSNKNCKGLLQINLGNSGEDEINIDEFLRLRAVCVSTSEAFTTTLPITINHFSINAELDAIDRITEVSSILQESKIILDDCSQCDSSTYENISSRLNNLKYQIKSCDFTSYVSIAFNLKNEAEEMKSNYGKISLLHEDEVEEIEEIEENMDEVKEQIEDVKEEIDSKVEEALDNVPKASTGGLCLIGLISPIILLLGFYLNRK